MGFRLNVTGGSDQIALDEKSIKNVVFDSESPADSKELLINNYLQNIPSCAILSSNISNCIGGKNGYTC